MNAYSRIKEVNLDSAEKNNSKMDKSIKPDYNSIYN